MLHIDISYPKVNNIEVVISSGTDLSSQGTVAEEFMKRISVSKKITVTPKIMDQVLGSGQRFSIKWKKLTGDNIFYFNTIGSLLSEIAAKLGYKIETDSTTLSAAMWRFRFMIFSKGNQLK